VKRQVVFIGLSGYDYPHTRVRCYNFAEQLNKYDDFSTKVISFRDHLSNLSEVEVYEARDRQKITMMLKALPRIFPRRNTIFYIQKAHYNAALPYLLYRLGFNNFVFDYDDYDVDLTVSFNNLYLRRFFYGTENHQEITRKLAANSLGCVAASRSLYDYVKQFNPRVEYVSTGVKMNSFNFVDRSDRTEPVRFLWTGIIWGEEIYQSVLRAFNGLREVTKSGQDSLLELVGTGQMWDRMIETLESEYADISDKVKITGWVTPDAMPDILAKADIGLLPFSEDSMWVRSKSPTKLFEYMATGLPVIADAIGEVRHVLQSKQSGILANNQDEFSKAMINLGADQKLRLELGLAARKRIESHYSIPVLIDRLARFLDTLFRFQS